MLHPEDQIACGVWGLFIPFFKAEVPWGQEQGGWKESLFWVVSWFELATSDTLGQALFQLSYIPCPGRNILTLSSATSSQKYLECIQLVTHIINCMQTLVCLLDTTSEDLNLLSGETSTIYYVNMKILEMNERTSDECKNWDQLHAFFFFFFYFYKY